MWRFCTNTGDRHTWHTTECYIVPTPWRCWSVPNIVKTRGPEKKKKDNSSISFMAVVIDVDGASFGITVCCWVQYLGYIRCVYMLAFMSFSFFICVAWGMRWNCNIILGMMWFDNIIYLLHNIRYQYFHFDTVYDSSGFNHGLRVALMSLLFWQWSLLILCHFRVFRGNGLRVLMWSNGPWLARSRHSLEPVGSKHLHCVQIAEGVSHQDYQ